MFKAFYYYTRRVYYAVRTVSLSTALIKLVISRLIVKLHTES